MGDGLGKAAPVDITLPEEEEEMCLPEEDTDRAWAPLPETKHKHFVLPLEEEEGVIRQEEEDRSLPAEEDLLVCWKKKLRRNKNKRSTL